VLCYVGLCISYLDQSPHVEDIMAVSLVVVHCANMSPVK
jgi:hypothetical protein